MCSYRRAIIVIALPVSEELAELIYLAQKPQFLYLDRLRRSRIRRPEALRLVNHPSCCVCSRCFRMDSLGCKIILQYLAPVLPDPGVIYDPERRATLIRILRRFKCHETAETIKSMIDSGRLPWGRSVYAFNNNTCQNIITPLELMNELRESVTSLIQPPPSWQ